MAGRKYGVVMAAKVPGSYFALSAQEQEEPGKVFEDLVKKYAGKVDFLRRYWTSAFTTEVSDVFVMECDDPMDVHNLSQELTQLLAKNGNPERFGVDVKIWFGINPDA
jgi:hypothetical protein